MPSYGQDVFVPRQPKPLPKPTKEEATVTEASKSETNKAPDSSADKKTESGKTHTATVETPHSAKSGLINFEPVKALSAKEPTSSSAKENSHPKKEEPSKSVATSEQDESKKKPVVSESTAKKEEVKRTGEVAAKKKTQEEPRAEKERMAKTEPPQNDVKKEKTSAAKSTKEEAKSTADVAAKKKTQDEPGSEKERIAKTEPNQTDAKKEKTATAKSEKGEAKSTAEVAAKKKTQEEPQAEKERIAKTEPTQTEVKKEKPSVAKPAKEDAKSTAEVAAKKKTQEETPLKQSEKEIASKATKEPDVTVGKPEAIKASYDLSPSLETASTRLADGFDFPVGKPDAEGYYKARGFRPNGHAGEDWDGVRGGDTDLRDPIYCIGDGIVVFARDVHMGWGKVVIVRHGYKEDGGVRYIDSLYGHLDTIMVKRGQKVRRGQQIATMGTAHGQYDAHLHFEIRKNIEIGMSKSKFKKNYSNYFSPTDFIQTHRRVPGGGTTFRVAMNTFTHDAAYNFDNAPNFSARKRSTAESSAALRRALSTTSGGSSRD